MQEYKVRDPPGVFWPMSRSAGILTSLSGISSCTAADVTSAGGVSYVTVQGITVLRQYRPVIPTFRYLIEIP